MSESNAGKEVGMNLTLNDDDKTAHKIFVILTIICAIYDIISIIVCVSIFIKRKHMEYFKQRGTTLTYMLLIESVLFCFIGIPLCIFSIQLYPHYYDVRITILFATLFMGCMLIVHTLRFWFMFLKIRRAQESASWKMLLNPNYKSWVVKYWWLFGKKKYVYIMYFVGACTASLIYVAVMFLIPVKKFGVRIYGYIILNIFTLISYVVTFIFIYSVVMKFNDYWKIKREMKTHFIVISWYALAVIVFVILISTGVITSFRIGIDYCALFIVTAMPGLWETATIYVEFGNTKYKEWSKNCKFFNDYDGDKSIIKLMETNKGYESFMNHLEKEFATENLLYITTLIQFQDILIELNVLDGNDVKLLIKHQRIKIADSVPKLIEKEFSIKNQMKTITNKILKRKSGVQQQLTELQTVFSSSSVINPDGNGSDNIQVPINTENDISTASHVVTPSDEDRDNIELAKVINGIYFEIYNKYIKEYESKLQINIPSRMRNKLRHEYNERQNDINILEINRLWNELRKSGNEIFRLLQDSHSRFDYDVTL